MKVCLQNISCNVVSEHYLLLGEKCPDGDEFEDPEILTDKLIGLVDNLEEMSLPTKVTFHVSDHDCDAAQVANI